MENKELNEAILAAILEFEPVYKESKGNRSKYAKLPAWLDMIVPILAKYKVRLRQPTVFENGFVLLKTQLIHTPTGQFEESVFPLDVGEVKSHEQKEHKEAGIQTYHRRYQIVTLLGLCGEDDDQDGYYAKEKTNSPQSNLPTVKATEKQVNYLTKLLIGRDDDRKKLLARENVESLDQLSYDLVSKSIEHFKGQ